MSEMDTSGTDCGHVRNVSATDELRRLLDERGVEWSYGGFLHSTYFVVDGVHCSAYEQGGKLYLKTSVGPITPEQAIAAMLGSEQRSDPVWEQWHEGLKHDDIKTIGDAVEQLMYESIKNGGYMGPNGNAYGGVDEGEVLTLGFINDWIEKFEATLGNDGLERSKNGVAETCVPDDYTAKLMAEVERLQGENAKLQKELEAEHTLAEQLGHYHEDAKVEIAKLRELAADMFRAMRRMQESADMDVMVGHSPWFAPKLHELGIEVD